MAARVAVVCTGWTLFAGSHMVLSHPPIRQDIINKIGKEKFLGMYSAVSLLTFVPTVYYYARHGRARGPLLYQGTSHWQKWLGNGFKASGAVLFSQVLFTKPIIEANPKGDVVVKANDVDISGVHRISRHSTFLSFALLGMGNLFTRGYLSDILFWGAFPVFWFVGSLHQDERLKLTLPDKVFEQTSVLPFQAVVEGKQSVDDVKKEFNIKAALVALVAPLFFL